MALSDNPTKTKTIEAAYRRETSKRFKEYKRFVTASLKASQKAPVTNALITNAFEVSQAEIDRLMKVYRARAYLDIIGVQAVTDANSAVTPEQTNRWQQKYINSAYIRGITQAQAQLKAQGVPTTSPTVADLQALYAVVDDEGTARVLASTYPLHASELGAMQQAANAGLIDAIETMLFQMREQIEKGNNVTPVSRMVKNVNERIDVGEVRGITQANTVTIHSYQMGQINNATIREIENPELGEIKLRWLTRKDNKVRHMHANWHGVVMTKKEADLAIQQSPYNCRCGFAQETEAQYNNAKRNAMFARERQKLLGTEGGKVPPKKKPKTPPTTPSTPAAPPPKPVRKPKNIVPMGYTEAGDIERAWVDKSLVNNGYNSILPTLGIPADAGLQKQGAWYNGGSNTLNMGRYQNTNHAAQAVYRHEYGHYVDYRKTITGTKQNKPYSSDQNYVEAKRLDGLGINEHTKALNKIYRAEKAGNTRKRGAGYVKGAFKEKSDNNFNDIKGDTFADVKAWGDANIPKNTMARELYDLIEFDNMHYGSQFDQAKLFTASLKEIAEKNDNPVLITQALWDHGGYFTLKKAHSEALHLTDMVNATNRDWGGGHSASYYASRYQADNREAFANLFSMSADSVADVYKKVADLLAPNQNKIVQGIINGR